MRPPRSSANVCRAKICSHARPIAIATRPGAMRLRPEGYSIPPLQWIISCYLAMKRRARFHSFIWVSEACSHCFVHNIGSIICFPPNPAPAVPAAFSQGTCPCDCISLTIRRCTSPHYLLSIVQIVGYNSRNSEYQLWCPVTLLSRSMSKVTYSFRQSCPSIYACRPAHPYQ